MNTHFDPLTTPKRMAAGIGYSHSRMQNAKRWRRASSRRRIAEFVDCAAWFLVAVMAWMLHPSSVSWAWGAGTIETIALTGQAVPSGGTFAEFDAPLINEAGQLVFLARLDGDVPAVFVYDPLAGDVPLQQVARRGLDLPETLSVGTGQYASFSTLLISRQDRVAFQANQRAGASGPGIYMPTGPSPFHTIGIVRRGDWAPRLWQFLDVSLKGVSGTEGEFTKILFTGKLNVPEEISNNAGLYLVPNAIIPGVVELAVDGEEETPGGDRFMDMYGVSATMNASGLIAFAARLRTFSASNDSAIYAGGYRSTRMRLVREGDAAPGGGVFSDFFHTTLTLNDSGQVAFSSIVEPSISGIFRIRSGELPELVVRSETTAPEADGSNDGRFSGLQWNLTLNNEGQVAFLSRLEGTSRGINNDSGIFRAGSGSIVSIVHEGQAMSGAGQFIDMGPRDTRKLSINNHGIVAFFAYFDTIGTRDEDEGIFLGDGEEIENIVLEGRTLGDSTRVVRVLGARCLSANSLNDAGQVAFVAQLDGGDNGIFLYTPEARYSPPEPYLDSVHGSWDSQKEWWFGLFPRAVHRVRLFAKQNLTINGPAKQTTIKSLVIAAAEKATMHLRLNQGPLVIREALDIKLRGSIEVGSMLEVQGKANTNSGKILNSGGTLMVKGGLTNTDSGSISGSGLFRWPGGLINRGRIEINNAATVFGPVMHEAGSLIVHEGATVAFHGDVTALHEFKGSGEVAFAARLRLGNKKDPAGQIPIEGDVRFGPDASLEINLGGTKLGKFDTLAISGHAVLDGTLTVRPVGKYVPTAGDQFKILFAKQITGNFARVKAPSLPKGLSFIVKKQANAIELMVVDKKS